MTVNNKYSHSVLCTDGRRRNFMRFFVNDIEILTLKWPYEENYEKGCQNRTDIQDICFNIETRYLHFTKIKGNKIRKVKYPVSKEKILKL